MTKMASALLLTTLSWGNAWAFDLAGTAFEQAGQETGIDPLLIYSVALAESATGDGNNKISPWPWTLRTPQTPFYIGSKQEAEEKLNKLLGDNNSSVDIGFMQISLYWHGHRVSSPADLLDPQKNIFIGASILSETIQSAPTDYELGIGRYHTWKDEARARNYGRRILAIYHNLQEL